VLRDIPCLVGAPPAMLNSWRKGKHQRVRSEFDESLNGQDLGTRLVELNKDGGDVGLTLENNQKNKTGVLVAAVATGKLAEVAGVAIGDCLLSVNGRAVSTASEAEQLIENATGRVDLGFSVMGSG